MPDPAPPRHDANVLTELLEVLLDRRDRGDSCERERLPSALGVAAEEVDLAIDHLEREGAIVDEAGRVTLTDDGYDLAVVAVRRHRLAERLLLDVVGLDWWKVHHEAERWEGVISDEVEGRIVELLGDPGTCPHGNPIPGSRNRPDQSRAIRLDEAPLGPVRVVRISETLESDDEALQLLELCGFLPGRDAEVKDHRAGWVEVAGTVRDAALPPHVTSHTFVTPH